MAIASNLIPTDVPFMSLDLLRCDIRLVHAEAAAVDDVVRACHEGGVVAAHEEDNVNEFVRLASASERSGHSAHCGTGEDGTGRHTKCADVVRATGEG